MFHCSYRLAKILFADVARKPQMEDNCFMYWHFKTISRLDKIGEEISKPPLYIITPYLKRHLTVQDTAVFFFNLKI